MIHKFTPKQHVVGHIDEVYSLADLKLEPMLFGASLAFAKSYGGAITKAFLDHVEHLWDDDLDNPPIIDSRVHMLKAGWYPAIPGWHLDDRPRGGPRNQPDIFCQCETEHLLAVVDLGTGSLTEFLTSPLVVERQHFSPQVLGNENVYAALDTTINIMLNVEDLKSEVVHSGDVLSFTSSDWHRAVPASGDGWRFFIRASRKTPRKTENEIRPQVQVYIPGMDGW